MWEGEVVVSLRLEHGQEMQSVETTRGLCQQLPVALRAPLRARSRCTIPNLTITTNQLVGIALANLVNFRAFGSAISPLIEAAVDPASPPRI